MENQKVAIVNNANIVIGFLVRVDRVKWQLCDLLGNPYNPVMANKIMMLRASYIDIDYSA